MTNTSDTGQCALEGHGNDKEEADKASITMEPFQVFQLLQQIRDLSVLSDDEERGQRGNSRKGFGSRVSKTCTRAILLAGVVCVSFMMAWITFQETKKSNSPITAPLQNEVAPRAEKMEKEKTFVDLNIGLRQDFRLQDCNEHIYKRSFPDMDYSMLGYNALRGYPLATGHDPGFTFPIFVADYSKEAQTADCRYSVPEGFVIIPDVSCTTSFTSKTVESSRDFSKTLSASANIKGGGWGVSFSASAGYKQSSSELSSGQSVFILSSAECHYYFSKLNKDSPPKFHPDFLEWVGRLDKAATSESTTDVYLRFLDKYGTHFPTYMTYGARYTYQHKMSSSKFQASKSRGINVAVQAGYSGIVSVGGGFSLDSSQREAASNFQKNVETTSFTVGAAPPANGDAMTWASEVKDTPVPTKYELLMISDLFTEEFLGDTSANLQRIKQTLLHNMPMYCYFLKKRGDLTSCQADLPGIMLDGSRLMNHFKLITGSRANCSFECLITPACQAITFENDRNAKELKCFMYKNNDGAMRVYAGKSDPGEYTTILHIKNNINGFRLAKTKIDGSAEWGAVGNVKYESCHKLCEDEEDCVAFDHCDCKDNESNCMLYKIGGISALKTRDTYITTFLR